MGSVCGSEKQAQRPGKGTPSQTHPNLPQSKYSLLQPQESAIKGADATAMIVSEGLAYNFLAKQGVLRQKGVAAEGDCIFLYASNEEKSLALKYHQIGLIGISSTTNEILEDSKTARVLFNFKTLWVFRDARFEPAWLPNFLRQLESVQVKPKQINLYPQPLSTLVEKYNLMDKSTSILNSFFPLQIYQSCDILNDQTNNNGKEEGFNVYLHGINHVQKVSETQINLYSQCLHIRNILFLFEGVDLKIIKTLEMQGLYKVDVIQLRNEDGSVNGPILQKIFIPYLQKMKVGSSNILLVHDLQSSQLAFEALSEYLSRDQLVHKQDIDIYLEQRRAVVVHGNTRLKSQINQGPRQPEQEQMEITKSRCEEMIQYYKDLNIKTKSSLSSQSLHRTVLRLLENIITQPTDNKFRTIQYSNKTIQLNVLQYQEGVEILKLCGFLSQPEENPTGFVNVFEVGMIKLCRGDLELAFKQASETK